MKKILVILNASFTPQQLSKTAISIAKESKSLLEAIFLDDLSTLNFGYPFPNDLFLTERNLTGGGRSDESIQLMEHMAKEFRDECEQKKVEYKIEVNKSVSIHHLITLSRFADLIIADSKPELEEYSLKDILIDAHCPVLLVSRNAANIERIFFAYDGSPSCMYAIKMFSYIFPEFKNLPTQLFHIAPGESKNVENMDEINTWASMHFTNFSTEVIQGNTRKEIVEHIRNNSEKIIIVMGAFSGSSIARLFLSSTSKSIIEETNASLFITHE